MQNQTADAWPMTQERQKQVLKNCHELLRKTRRFRGVPLWSAIHDMTGHGMGYSSAICKANGWDANQPAKKQLV